MKTSQEIVEITKALLQAQKAIKPARKDSTNPHLKSKYSDLATVWDAIKEPLSANGLVIMQDVTALDNYLLIETRIVHISGQWMEFGPFKVPVGGKGDAQAYGSSCTYGRRYAVCAALGVVSSDDIDDDGEASVGRPYEEQKREASSPTQEAPKSLPVQNGGGISEKQLGCIRNMTNKMDGEFVDGLLDRFGLQDFADASKSIASQIIQELNATMNYDKQNKK